MMVAQPVYQSSYRGIAPGASIYSLRTMDHQGGGYTSDVIAALDWIHANAGENGAQYPIRVVNLSLGHPVYASAADDPLVQAVEILWDNDGIVVVCSAGNDGREEIGRASCRERV